MPKKHPSKKRGSTPMQDRLKRLVFGFCEVCQFYVKPCKNPNKCINKRTSDTFKHQ